MSAGLLVPGTIDPFARPRVDNPDGTYSTLRTITVEDNGRIVFLPTVVGGRVVSPQEAVDHYRRTGDLEFLRSAWPVVEQAAAVCGGASGHPGLRMHEDLSLLSSASDFSRIRLTQSRSISPLRKDSDAAETVMQMILRSA